MSSVLTVSDLAEFTQAIFPLFMLGSFIASFAALVAYDLIGMTAAFFNRDKS